MGIEVPYTSRARFLTRESSVMHIAMHEGGALVSALYRGTTRLTPSMVRDQSHDSFRGG